MKKLVITTALIGLTSCASIVEGSKNKVDIVTSPAMQGTNCSLTNGLGTWQSGAPGSTTVHRSKTDLKIDCNNPTSGATGTKVVESDMEPWFLGNIVLGGIIGGGVDWATGDMWKYPNDVTVSLVGAQPVIIQPVPMAAPAPMPVPTPPAYAQPQVLQQTYPTGRQ